MQDVDRAEAADGTHGNRARVEVYPTVDAMMRTEAERIVTQARSSILARQQFSLVLSGGGTPRRLYELLAQRKDIEWPRVHVFWGDERCVPPTHASSNYRMAREALLDHAAIPAANVHRMVGEDPPDDAARAYEQLLRRMFTGDRTFDCVLLGMGEDGHTASLFPGTPAVIERERWVMATQLAESRRITLTPVVLEGAEEITFLVSGASKAARIREVIAGADLPVQHIRSKHGTVRWLLDADAASELRRAS